MSLVKTIEMGVKVRMRADRKCHSIHIHSYWYCFLFQSPTVCVPVNFTRSCGGRPLRSLRVAMWQRSKTVHMGLWVRTPTHQVFIIIDTCSFDSLFLLPAWLSGSLFLLLMIFKWMLLLLGDAKRNCSKTELWSEPDLFNCTNKDFVSLESQVWDWENIKRMFEGISQTFVSFRKVIDIFFKFLLISNWLKRLKLLLHTLWSNLLGFKK